MLLKKKKKAFLKKNKAFLKKKQKAGI